MRRPARVPAAVLALTALALLTRFVGLGARPFHWGEARVGYWILRSLETGVYEYRPVAGGPFLYLVDRVVFGVLGDSDLLARSVVALVGGLLPLAALLFHDPGGVRRRRVDGGEERGGDAGADDAGEATAARRTAAGGTTVRDGAVESRLVDWRVGLSGAETVSLALILAVAPPLLYYSRFLRGDVPLAAFGLVAVGLCVRAGRTGSRRSLYAAGAAAGLALTTSALAVAMLACWLVAAVLAFDEGRVRRESSATLVGRAGSVVDFVRDRATPVARAALVSLGVVVCFFAPRGGEDSLYDPASIPDALYRATFGAGEAFFAVFVSGRQFNGHALLPYVEGLVGVLVATALPLLVLGLYGFLRERYVGPTRPLVAFAAYWAGVGVLFFAGATEANAPWVAVHVVVPLAIPAAVGLASFADWGRGALESGEAVPVAVTLLLVLAGGIHLGAVVAGDVYAPPDRDSRLAQYAQPTDSLRPAVENATAAIEGNEGVDVLYVGEPYVAGVETGFDSPPVPPGERETFSARLPLSWYFERADAETSSVARPEAIPRNPPPVVVSNSSLRTDVRERLGDGYRAYEVDLGLYDRTVVIFVAR